MPGATPVNTIQNSPRHRSGTPQSHLQAALKNTYSLLVTGYMLLWTGQKFEDLGADYFDHLDRERLTKRLVKRLEKLGHKVVLQPDASS